MLETNNWSSNQLIKLICFSARDTPEKVDYVLDKIEDTFSSLADNPERESDPNELLAVGLREYREIYFKPYRITYRTIEKYVYVMMVVAICNLFSSAACSRPKFHRA